MILPSTMVAWPRVSADGLHARDAMLKASIADCMAMYAYGLVLRMLLPTDVFPDLRFILQIYGGQIFLLHWFLCAHHCFTSVECGRSHATMQRMDYDTNIRCISWQLLRGLWLVSGRHCVHNVVVLRSHCVSAMPFNWAVDSRDEATSRCQARCQQ